MCDDMCDYIDSVQCNLQWQWSRPTIAAASKIQSAAESFGANFYGRLRNKRYPEGFSRLYPCEHRGTWLYDEQKEEESNENR